MKIGIVGPISKDRMVLPAGGVESGWGAAAYSALALARLLEGTGGRVVCLTHLSPEDAAEARALLDHPNIVLPAIDSPYTAGTKIELSQVAEQERVSRQTQIMTPIAPGELRLLADCDELVLMPLNATDIPLAAVEELRAVSRAEIFLDVHGLITGVDAGGRRYKKNWDDVDRWLTAIDILKMNDREAPWVAGRPLRGREDYARFAGAMVGRGLSVCWITFGDRSSLIAWRRQGRILWASVPVVAVGEVVNTVGCGDSASAGFIYSYALLHNPVLAVVLGNTFGSARASLATGGEFPSKPEVRGLVCRHYRDYLHTLLDEFLTQEHVIVHEIKEAASDEDSLHGADGHGNGYGADHAGGGDRQSPGAPGP